jgi:NADPH:quinone reductase-like Zn-dependent oxidoreductase
VRAALIEELGRPPEPRERDEPGAGGGEVLVEIDCVPLNPIDINVGAGRFYRGHPPVPFVPGSEAVGRVRRSGQLVWVNGGGLGVERDGCLAELVAAPESALVPVPDDADPAVAGACGVAGMAGWLPITWRAPVREGDRVLVLGATGTVGLVALQAAKLRGAARVVAAGRNLEGLERARRAGADEVVQLDGESLADRIQEAFGGDGPTYVLDPIWGEPVVAAMDAAALGARIVQLGQSAGATATIPSSFVRGKVLEIVGFSNFAVPGEVVEREYRTLVEHAMRGDVDVDVERVPFDQVADAWRRQADGSAARKLVVEVRRP